MSVCGDILLLPPLSATITRNTAPVDKPHFRYRLHCLTSSTTIRTRPFILLSLPHSVSHSTTKRIRRCNRLIPVAPCSTSSSSLGGTGDSYDFVVVNFYKFVLIRHPQEEISKHLSFVKGLDIHGRIYINEQGINAQYSGPLKDALAYSKWIQEDFRFSDILVQISPAFSGHAFPKLRLRYKPSLVQLEGGISHLPLLDPSMRATPLEPSEWRRKLKAAHQIDEKTESSVDSDCVLLDVRNGYEWDIGHFHGAERPDVDCFRSTSFGVSCKEDSASDPLLNVDKDKTDILMYCTGGIRCDVYSTILRQRGFQNLYTLKGGVSHYLESEGPVEWTGNFFVFDDRLSIPPSYKPEATTSIVSKSQQGTKNNLFAYCYTCGSQVSVLRHRNCANIDCNLLFLCCEHCVKNLRGCCCLECTTAPRLRPLLPGNQRYKKWYTYRDKELEVPDQLTI